MLLRQEVMLVYLSLEEVSGDNFAPVTVEEGKGSRESGSGDTPEDGLSDHTSPARLCGVDSYTQTSDRLQPQWTCIRTLVEEVVEEQRLEVLVLLVGGSDITKEHTL